MRRRIAAGFPVSSSASTSTHWPSHGSFNLDNAIEKPLKSYFDNYHTMRMENFRLSDEEIIDGGRGEIIVQPTKARVS